MIYFWYIYKIENSPADTLPNWQVEHFFDFYIGSASISEATSRSETPIGTGSVGNVGVSKRGRKGRRKGPHLTGRSPKLQFKCVGFLKEDHGQV